MSDDLYARIATALGCQLLVCRTCKTEQLADHEAVAGFLRDGWPICCGQTMSAIDASMIMPGALDEIDIAKVKQTEAERTLWQGSSL